MRTLWYVFPCLFTLPFLLSTTKLGLIASASEPARWLMMLVGVAAYFHPILQASRRRFVNLGLADVLLFSFAGAAFVSSLWSIDTSYSFQRAVSLLLLLLLVMWSLWRYADVLGESHLLSYTAGTVAVVLGINLIVGPALDSYGQYNRFSGFFDNPNNIGLMTCLLIPLTLGMWLRSHQRIYLVFLVIALLSLFAAGTRSATIGAGLACLLILLSVRKVNPSRTIVIFVAALAGSVVFAQSDFFDERILRAESLSTASNRTIFWELARQYISERPWVGHGFGTDALIHDYYHVDLMLQGLRGYGVMSSYLGLAVQMGWLITILFFLALWILVGRCIVLHWRQPDIVILGATILSGLVVCIFEPAIYSAGNAFSFMFWLCVMLALRRLAYAGIASDPVSLRVTQPAV